MKTKDFLKLLKKEGITIGGQTRYDDYEYFDFADDGSFRQIKRTDADERNVVSVTISIYDGQPMVIVD